MCKLTVEQKIVHSFPVTSTQATPINKGQPPKIINRKIHPHATIHKKRDSLLGTLIQQMIF